MGKTINNKNVKVPTIMLGVAYLNRRKREKAGNSTILQEAYEKL